MTTIPTPRLTLRPIPAAGWTGYYGLMASDRSIYMDSPFSTAEARGMCCADHAQWSLFTAEGPYSLEPTFAA